MSDTLESTVNTVNILVEINMEYDISKSVNIIDSYQHQYEILISKHHCLISTHYGEPFENYFKIYDTNVYLQ